MAKKDYSLIVFFILVCVTFIVFGFIYPAFLGLLFEVVKVLAIIGGIGVGIYLFHYLINNYNEKQKWKETEQRTKLIEEKQFESKYPEWGILTKETKKTIKLGEERRTLLNNLGVSYSPNNNRGISRLSDIEFNNLLKELQDQKEKDEQLLKLGKERRTILYNLGISYAPNDNWGISHLTDDEFNVLLKELQYQKEDDEIKLNERLKKIEKEKEIILIRIQKCRSNDLEDLPYDLKEYKINQWKEKIGELLSNNYTENEIIKRLCSGDYSPIDVKADFIKDNEIDDIVESILKFEMPRIPPKFNNNEIEAHYHSNLFSFLKGLYPIAKMDIDQRGSSRPDITIDDVAIEVKGPTNCEDLKTIADKLTRYPVHFKKEIIVVLFEIRCNKIFFNDWKVGIQRIHSHLILIEERDGSLKKGEFYRNSIN